MAGVTPSGAAMSAERLDLAELVGDVEIPCEAQDFHQRSPGDEPASWVVWQVRCCPAVRPSVLVCDPCLQRAMQLRTRGCPDCGTAISPYRHSITRFERIDKTPGRHPGGPA